MTTGTITETPGRWRTLDIVVTAVIGVAFGVVFWAWGFIFNSFDPVFVAFKPAQYLISGVWLMPAVIAPLIVRKPGAALFAEILAAAVSAMLGSFWGLDVLLSGFVQGAGAELVFAVTLYRAWSLPVAMLAGAGAAVGEALHDIAVYYPEWPADWIVVGTVAMIVSGIVFAGIGGWALVRGLRGTGVLDTFPSGR